MIKKAFFILIILSGCIEPFQPEVALDSSFVVVTGGISNENKVKVNIERSLDSTTGLSSKIIGATVTLLGDDGTVEILDDQGNGVYAGETLGVANVSYSIEVILPNSRVIKSDWQLLKPGPEVGNLFIEQSTRPNFVDGYEFELDGLNLNLYMNETELISTYYRWTLEGTYEFHSPLSSDICYITDFFTGNFLLGESVSINKDLITKQLAFLESNGSKFSLGYSMEVTQYTLNDEAYNYWKKIDDQQNNVGSVFDAPPAQIIGNLTYVEEIEQPVLGFFEANFITKKRIFIRPTDFVKEPILETSPCGFDNPPGWCTDCTTIVGSGRDKPSYWPY